MPALLASDNDIKSFSKTGQRRDLNREKFKFDNLSSILENPNSNAHKNLKYLRNAMDIRSKMRQFHPHSKMQCLSKDRSDIVVIKRGEGVEAVFAIHNMTSNKINYQLKDKELYDLNEEKFNMNDYLTSNKYNCNNIILDPFQVIWLGCL